LSHRQKSPEFQIIRTQYINKHWNWYWYSKTRLQNWKVTKEQFRKTLLCMWFKHDPECSQFLINHAMNSCHPLCPPYAHIDCTGLHLIIHTTKWYD